MKDLTEKRKHIDDLLSEHKTALTLRKNEKKNLIAGKNLLADTEEAQVIIQHIAQTIQQQAHHRITKVVSTCLETVFEGEDVYGFKIRFERKRGKTEAVLVLTKNNNEIDDPLEGDSGGVLDVAAFALRLSCIILAKPHLRKIVVLDEPFKFVSEKFLPNVRMMLEGLAEDFNFQFIMITHIKGLQTGKVIVL